MGDQKNLFIMPFISLDTATSNHSTDSCNLFVLQIWWYDAFDENPRKFRRLEFQLCINEYTDRLFFNDYF